MKKRIFCLLWAACILSLTFFPCFAEETESETAGEIGAFRPVDCGVQAQEAYEYPFIGLTFKLSESLLESLSSRDVFAFTYEEYSDEDAIAYAMMRFSVPTEDQKSEECMSVDILSWETALDKLGAIGVYQKEMTLRLDELTGCDRHEKIGESSNGVYEYYLSTNSSANQALAEELKKAEITIGEMHQLDFSMGYSAFSTDRVDGVDSVGEFSTTDVFGNTCTQEIFQNYDLTLVNVFATWCSPCVNEMPDLEKLRQAYESKNIQVGVVAVVIDVKTAYGIDEGALEQAQSLHERCDAQFPFLIPDDGNMNERLTGIESFPESFFVDRNGNIVSEPYLGVHSLEEWEAIVDEELAKLS